MANSNGWGDGSANNNIGWGQGAVNNNVSWGKSHIDSWSGATDIDGGNPPVNSVAPAITGTAQEGQTLTCSTGTWSGTPTYSYQWKRNGSNIGSATNSTYTLVTADVGQSIKCTVTATNALGSSNADSNTVTPTSSTDPDAQAFITAAAITDPTQQSAINTLVTNLKGYNIWTKMKALYPFVGGTASTHKFNLKNPLDTDAAYRIFWSGGVTHSSNGVQFGGVNGSGNTFLNSSVNLTTSNNHFSVYSRTSSVAATTVEMGCANTGAVNYNQLRIAVNYIAGNLLITSFTSTTNAQGFWLGNKRDNNDRRVYKNSTKEATNTTLDSTTLPNFNVFIGARNDNGTAVVYSDKQLAFSSIGDGLTDTEAANLYTAVQAFQTTLNRNV